MNDRGQPNYASMFDPVLGPLNSYKRGGPAVVSPHNIRSKYAASDESAILRSDEDELNKR